MLVLSEVDVKRVVQTSLRKIIDLNRKALLSLGESNSIVADVPTRTSIPYCSNSGNNGEALSGADCTLFKPAMYREYINGKDSEKILKASLGIKVVSVRDKNSNIGKSIVPASTMLIDPETGSTKALMNSTWLTAARTAAGSACSTEIMCLPRLFHSHREQNIENSSYPSIEIVCFGAGLQIEMHIAALRRSRWPSQSFLKIRKVTIVNKSIERASSLKSKLMSDIQYEEDQELQPITNISTLLLDDNEQLEEVVRGADIIVTATNTLTPLFPGEWVKDGAHICGVGSYVESMQEVDEAVVQRCHVAYDTKEALKVGDLKSLQSTKHGVLLADLIAKEDKDAFSYCIPNDYKCSFFKSVGTAIQDLISAEYVLEKALEKGVGTQIEI